ncbi:PREDICTED: sialin-like [Nicrophorus vespilloides]|uniref:Sialin-like n=1 Tax=Nicrophorus vespilloides TaxID=110193 RepID=A0ABM1MM00_NICVS|nr:PREDICTED: sialin-like [Nicrophorus vespilloides]
MPTNPCYCSPMRHAVIMSIMTAVGICYAQRVVLNMGITEMIKFKDTESPCPLRNITYSNTSFSTRQVEPTGDQKDWGEFGQGVLLCSFYAAWTLFQFLLIFVARLGGRFSILVGMAITSLATGLLPFGSIFMPIDFMNWVLLTLLRAAAGIGQAMVQHGINRLFIKWIWLEEKKVTVRLINCSKVVGIYFASITTGWLIKVTSSWHIPFFVFGAAGILWILFALFYVFADPEKHPMIQSYELEDLKDKVVAVEDKGKGAKDLAIFALALAQFGNEYVFLTLFTNYPKFLQSYIKMDLMEITQIGSLPYLMYFMGYFVFSMMCNNLFRRNLRVSCVYKFCVFIGLVVPAALLLVLIFLQCHIIGVLIVVSIALFLNGAAAYAIDENCLSLSLHFYPFIVTVCNACGGIAGTVTPMVIAIIAKDNSEGQWTWIFYFVIIVAFAMAICYAVMGSARRAKWDYKDNEEQPAKTKTKWYQEKPPE